MNRDNVIRARDLMIEVRDAGSTRFDMSNYFTDIKDWYSWRHEDPSAVDILPGRRSDDPHKCGTSACLAGWLQLRFAKGRARSKMAFDYGVDFLGIDDEDAQSLFSEAEFYGKDELYEVTVDDVITKLNEMINA